MRNPLKITVYGSESTGKTTLAEQLAAHFGTGWVPEYARAYQEKHPRPLTYRDVTPIARGQMRLEARHRAHTPRLLICDTDIVQTKVYSETYYGRSPAWLQRILPRHYADLYLFTGIDLPWIPDGIRDRPDDRQAMHRLFEAELLARRLAFVAVSGPSQTRLHQAVAAVSALPG